MRRVSTVELCTQKQKLGRHVPDGDLRRLDAPSSPQNRYSFLLSGDVYHIRGSPCCSSPLATAWCGVLHSQMSYRKPRKHQMLVHQMLEFGRETVREATNVRTRSRVYIFRISGHSRVRRGCWSLRCSGATLMYSVYSLIDVREMYR